MENLKLLEENNLINYFSHMSLGRFISSLMGHNKKYFKFRLFDDFYYMNDLNDYSCILGSKDVLMHVFIGNNLKLNDVRNIGYNNITFDHNVYIRNDRGTFPLLGYYLLKDSLVFCSYPNVKTIKNLFKKNPSKALNKFQSCYLLNFEKSKDLLYKIIKIKDEL